MLSGTFSRANLHRSSGHLLGESEILIHNSPGQNQDTECTLASAPEDVGASAENWPTKITPEGLPAKHTDGPFADSEFQSLRVHGSGEAIHENSPEWNDRPEQRGSCGLQWKPLTLSQKNQSWI